MAVYPSFAAALAAVGDPATAPGDLAIIAQNYPTLQAAVAGHPAAYDGLLDWIVSYGDAQAVQAVAARRGQGAVPSDVPVPQPADSPVSPISTDTVVSPRSAPSFDPPAVTGPRVANPSPTSPLAGGPPPVDGPLPTSGSLAGGPPVGGPPPVAGPDGDRTPMPKKKPRRTALIISLCGAIVVIVAVVLVVALIIVPAQKDKEQAVNDFNAAVTTCQDAAAVMATEIDSAKGLATTYADGAAVLGAGVSTAEESQDCDVPDIAGQTAEIQTQISALDEQTEVISSATDDLTTLTNAVTAFQSSVESCQNVNDVMAKAITDAEAAAGTDPGAVADPNVLDDLTLSIATAKAAAQCAVPAIGGDSAAIQTQTDAMSEQIDTVGSRTILLQNADSAVDDSVVAKKKADDEAKYKATHTASVVVEDSNGYKRQYDLTVSDWVLGSDATAMSKTWEEYYPQASSVSMPLTDGSYPLRSFGSSTGSEIDFVQNTAVYVFGKVTVKNLSTGFTADEFTGLSPMLVAEYDDNSAVEYWGNSSSAATTGAFVHCAMYSNDTECVAPEYDSFVSPKMTSDTWGPVSVVIALGKTMERTPNNPNGSPALDSMRLKYGDQTVTPHKTW